MTVIATASNPLFRVSRMEVDRDGPTYAVDTLRELKARTRRRHRPVLRDRRRRDAGDLPVEAPEELFDLAHFIAATRPGYDIEAFERARAHEACRTSP